MNKIKIKLNRPVSRPGKFIRFIPKPSKNRSLEKEIKIGSIPTNMAPKNAPWIEPSPPITIINNKLIDKITLKVS